MKTQPPTPHRQTARKQRFDASTAAGVQSWAGTLIAAARHQEGTLPGSDEPQAASWHSLWSLQLFLTISIAAFFVRGFDLYVALPENVLQILGCPPPPTLVHLALAGYVLTVLLPLGIHLLNGEKPAAQWRHLGYRSAFYAFYLCSGTLTAHFFLVFTTGILLYLLEQAALCFLIARAGRSDGQLV